MTLSVVPAESSAVPTITTEQLELIKKTVAKDATADELRLFLHDCARQGVHPLDHLLHFTKRGGRYTPVTSIDLMRMRAAETGEYAGNDEYEFTGTPGRPGFKAVARVWRLVQGHRVAFARPARWEEYCPPPGQDHMWRRMPHVMLGKCAEAQALRAGFPRQLHGLYAAEELQAGDDRPGPAASPAAGRSTTSPPISAAQRKRLFARARDGGWTSEQLKGWLHDRGIEGTQTIRQDQYDAILEALALERPVDDRDPGQEG